MDNEHLPFRCGVSDELRSSLDARWRKKSLTYHVSAYVPGLAQSAQDDLLDAAFQSWMDVADLTITRTPGRDKADLIIATGRGGRAGFDGKGGTLAWAQLPPGDDRQLLMRFDTDEDWTEQLFRAVAAHEFGHLLGLDHSRHKTALMFPYASLRIWTPQEVDDIPRIRTYYGAPPVVPPPPPSPGIVEMTAQLLDLAQRLHRAATEIHGSK